MKFSRHRAVTAVLVVIAVVVALGVTVGMVRSSSDGSDGGSDMASAGHQGRTSHEKREEAERGGSRELAEALEKHPGLAKNRMALAFVSEKLEQQGGEASGEILKGPSQESYDQRAFPHKAIAPAEQRQARSAFAKADTRSSTPAGRQTLASAQSGSPSATVRRWSPAGPSGGTQAAQASYTGTAETVSGRTTSLVTGGSVCTSTRCVLYAGTAGGGLWKTSNALATTPSWTSIGHDIPSTAIGSVYRKGNTLYVGTGEPNGSADSEAGVGLYRSTDRGDSFSRVSTIAGGSDFTVGRSVGAVAVDPADSKHVYVGTAVARHGTSSVNGGRFTPPGAAKIGLYETRDGGQTWRLALNEDSDVVDPSSPTGNDYFRGGISKILFDPTHKGTVYASMFDYGLYRSTASGSWKQIYTIKTPGDPATGLDSRVEFALATLSSGKTRIYLGDATFFAGTTAALLRSDDGTTSSPAFKLISNPKPGTPGYGSYNFCEGQCSYDMAVSSPPGHPDQVFLSGSMNYDELQAFGGRGRSNGRAVVRSTDAGLHVTDMTNDGQRKPHGLHPDQHALVFVRTGSSKQTFITASDGGVVRQTAPYVDRSSDCTQRGLFGPDLVDCRQYLSRVPTSNRSANKGLQTLQFGSVSVSRPTGGVIQGGTQDNGTWESDQGGFSETVGGDGGQSAFDATSNAIRYHSYYSPAHDVSFANGNAESWDYISDPLVGSGEAASFYTPFVADPTVPGTVFDGLQHVWRTTDHGGSRAFLDKYCNELTGDYGNKPHACGDWQPLGGAAGDLSRGDAANYVVAVERAHSNDSTMWAATRKGDVYVSRNANAADPANVKFTRIDTKLGLPNRFPSGIEIAPANPRHAFISYSGYSAYSPGGHVYDATVDLTTGAGTAKDLSSNLGDQPVTDVVWVPSTRALYVSTDFGVLTRAAGRTDWVATPGLPQVAVYGLTLDPTRNTLYAATHGRSVWKLPVG